MDRQQQVEHFIKQTTLIRKLKRMGERKLRALHRKVFPPRSCYWQHLPRWIHRSIIEQRLWLRYTLSHPHFDIESKDWARFKANAVYVLTQPLAPVRREALARKNLADASLFSYTKIEKMKREEVDSYLSALGVYIEGTTRERARGLWELFNSPAFGQINSARKIRGGVARAIKSALEADPLLTWPEFIKWHGKDFPLVTPTHFRQIKHRMRRSGFILPNGKPGPWF